MKRKRFGTKFTLYLAHLITGFWVSAMAMVIFGGGYNDYENMIMGTGLILTVVLTFVINLGRFVIVEGDTIKLYKLFRVKKEFKLENFDLEKAGNDWVNKLVFKTDSETVTFETGFMGILKFNRLMKLLKPLSNNNGIKKAIFVKGKVI